MSDRITLLKRVASLDVSPQFDGYSKVIIHIDDKTQVSAGNDSGRVMEVTNPLGTQQMAERMLAKLRGYQYQPYNSEGTLLDPAAEVGDGVSIKNTYGGIYKRDRQFSRLMKADISAPHDEEIDHEYKFETPQERKYKREMGDVRATLLIQSDEIAARVEKTGGNASSFEWSLLSDKFSLYARNKEVFKATKDGVEIDGKITARTGYIGNGTNGFTITATAIYNNIPEFGGTQTKGVYLGTNGIQLGQNFRVNSSGAVNASNLTISGGSININNNFRVDSNGNLTANSGTFNGNVQAKNINYGGSAGYFNGGGIGGGTIGTGQLNSYCAGGVGGGMNFIDSSTSGHWGQSYFSAGSIYARSYLATASLDASAIRLAGSSLGFSTFKDYDGNYHTCVVAR